MLQNPTHFCAFICLFCPVPSITSTLLHIYIMTNSNQNQNHVGLWSAGLQLHLGDPCRVFTYTMSHNAATTWSNMRSSGTILRSVVEFKFLNAAVVVWILPDTEHVISRRAARPWLAALHYYLWGFRFCWSRVKSEKRSAHLVLLLEAVTLGTFHLSDVLQQVGHSDGRVQLTRLIGQGLPLRLPLLVVGLDQATGFTGHGVTVIWGRMMRGENRRIRRESGGLYIAVVSNWVEHMMMDCVWDMSTWCGPDWTMVSPENKLGGIRYYQ